MAGPATLYQEGDHASRPSNGSGCVLYFCTDHSKVYRDDGSTWTDWLVVPAAGAVGTDSIWDAAGDLVQGTGANTAAKLSLGTAGQVLRVNSGATAAEWGPGPVVPWNIAPEGMYVGATRASGASNRGHRAAVTIPVACTITGVRIGVGVQSGNISVCLYDASNNRVATSGTVACPANGSQHVAFTSGYAATPGRYWVGLSVDNTTATFLWFQDTTTGVAPVTGQFQASAHPLPDPFVSAGAATVPAMVLAISGGHP